MMPFQDVPTHIPDPEVVPKAERRKFSAEYKRRVLEEADTCTESGQIGALLRREGLYTSHLTTWRLQEMRRGRVPQCVDRRVIVEHAEEAFWSLQRETASILPTCSRRGKTSGNRPSPLAWIWIGGVTATLLADADKR